MQHLLLRGMPRAQLSVLTGVAKYGTGWNSLYFFRELKLIITRFLDDDISGLDTDYKKSWAQIEAGHLKLFLEWYLDTHPSARKLSTLKTFFRQWRQLYTLETSDQFDLKMGRDVNNVRDANIFIKIR